SSHAAACRTRSTPSTPPSCWQRSTEWNGRQASEQRHPGPTGTPAHGRISRRTTIGYQEIGAGPGLIVLGGALRTAEDYLPLASVLARSFTVYVVDRRGRGVSGPQGSQYALGKEVEDLHAVQTETGARLAFGHSYGGLVIFETARSLRLF